MQVLARVWHMIQLFDKIYCPILGDRLMVGQWPLKPLIGVRIPVPQQQKLED